MNVNVRKAGSYAMIISDEGKRYDKLLRKMRRFNYIPSAFGRWETGGFSKNITTDRIVEGIVYKDSRHSLFIQAADCCAYALLRHESQLPSKNHYGLHKSFYILEFIMVQDANRKDRYGIIR